MRCLFLDTVVPLRDRFAEANSRIWLQGRERCSNATSYGSWRRSATCRFWARGDANTGLAGRDIRAESHLALCRLPEYAASASHDGVLPPCPAPGESQRIRLYEQVERPRTMREASQETQQRISANWEQVQSEVAAACEAAGRAPAAVKIVGVSKYVGPELTEQLLLAGCQRLGENRPQSLWEKAEWFAGRERRDVHWHMIGHLQRNKVRRSLPWLQCFEALDSLRLAETVNQEALKLGIRLPVLIDVNVTQDPSKTGLPATELQSFVGHVRDLPGLQLNGLMAMSSWGADLATVRSEFALVRELRDQVQTAFGGQVALPELSMGMSGDFREAIAEGATLVRIGSNLWRGILEA